MVLGACQQSAKPPVATIPPASASAKSTAPAQAATSTVGATSSTAATRAATVRAPKKEKEKRTPALTDGAAPRPGGGEVL